MWYVRGAVSHSDMHSHHVRWLYPSWRYAMVFLICHVIMWSKVMLLVRWLLISSFPPVSFLRLWHDNIEKWYNKKRQLLQNESENCYCKVITNCDRSLLQSASGITKCDRSLSQIYMMGNLFVPSLLLT